MIVGRKKSTDYQSLSWVDELLTVMVTNPDTTGFLGPWEKRAEGVFHTRHEEHIYTIDLGVATTLVQRIQVDIRPDGR